MKRFDYIFVIGQLGLGGAEKQLFLLIKELKHDPVNICVIVWNEKGSDLNRIKSFSSLNVNIIFLKGTFLLKVFHSVKICYKEAKVISFSTYLNSIVTLIGILSFSDSYGSIRNSVSKNFGFNLMSLNFFVPKVIFVNSKKSISELPRIRFKYGKIVYLPNIINKKITDKYFFWNYNSISVSTCKIEKRLDRLIYVVSELVKEYPDYVHLHIGGGSMLNDFKVNIIKRGLENNIFFIGEVSDPSRYLFQGKIFLHFAEFEGTSNAVIEALVNKMIIISTNCGDIKEYCINDENSFISDPYSPDFFINKIKILKNDSYWREIMEEVIDTKFENNHSRDEFINNLK